MTDLRKAAEMALEALEKQHNWMVANDGMFQIPSRKAIQALRQALAQPEQEPLGSEWVPCMKLPVIVHVRNQRDGETHISTREGITPVLPDDLIMRGVAGEEYPIGRELFERTYTFDVDDVNMSEERVHKSDKREQEPVAWINYNAATGKETINRECHSELASTPLYKTPLQNEITCVCGAVWDGKLMTIPPRENKHEPVAWMYEWGGRTNFTTTDQQFVEAVYPHFVKSTPLYTAPPISDREWVGLTDQEIENLWNQHESRFDYYSFSCDIEAKLKEKNT